MNGAKSWRKAFPWFSDVKSISLGCPMFASLVGPHEMGCVPGQQDGNIAYPFVWGTFLAMITGHSTAKCSIPSNMKPCNVIFGSVLARSHERTIYSYSSSAVQKSQSRFLGRGCDEALFSEQKGFSLKRGEAIQWMRVLVRISTGNAIQWRAIHWTAGV